MADTERLKARLLEALGPGHRNSYPETLEQHFPHVFERIVDLWGTPEMEDYFQELLVTTRANRQGFPTEAASEILGLFRAYHDLGLARPAAKGLGTAWDWIEELGRPDKSGGA